MCKSPDTVKQRELSDVTRRALENPYSVLTVVIFAGNMINGTFTLILLAFPILGDEFQVDESVIVWVSLCAFAQ